MFWVRICECGSWKRPPFYDLISLIRRFKSAARPPIFDRRIGLLGQNAVVSLIRRSQLCGLAAELPAEYLGDILDLIRRSHSNRRFDRRFLAELLFLISGFNSAARPPNSTAEFWKLGNLHSASCHSNCTLHHTHQAKRHPQTCLEYGTQHILLNKNFLLWLKIQYKFGETLHIYQKLTNWT